MLTDAQIHDVQPQAKPYKVADARGLYVMVYPSGVKSFRWKYRVAGREKLLTFGRHPLTSVISAREKADAARRLLKNGIDPGRPDRQSLEQYRARLATLPIPISGSNKVYFVQAISGHIKIGVTANVAGRVQLLQWANPEPVELLAVMPGSKEHETVLHQMFCDHRDEGEWFTPGIDLLAFIRDLRGA